MAHAYPWEARGCWRASFRGVRSPPGKYRVIRVPADRIKSKRTAAADADRFAQECERLCRMLEDEPSADLADRARRINAITEEQHEEAVRSQPIQAAISEGRLTTIREAALAHPSSLRDPLERQKEYAGYVDQFTAWAGTASLAALTVDRMVQWIAVMRSKGLAFDTRRHRLLYLRRAARMGVDAGHPNRLAGITLDVREARGGQEVWSLEQLIAAILAARTDRQRAVYALGGLLGLRPSEICREEPRDLIEDVLTVGAREAKNRSSRRWLPVPPTALRMLRAVCQGRPPADAMIEPVRYRTKGRRSLTLSGLRQVMEDAPLPGLPPIAVKDLRKTFATWASRVISGRDLERYLGHQSALLSPITSRNYLGPQLADELRPACALLEAAIVKAMRAAKKSAA